MKNPTSRRRTPAPPALLSVLALCLAPALGCMPSGSLSSHSDEPDSSTDAEVLRLVPADRGPGDAGADAQPEALPEPEPEPQPEPEPEPQPEPEPDPEPQPEPEPEPQPEPEPEPQPEPDPEPEPPRDPCDGVACPPNAACVAGACACQPGFVPDGDRCVEPARSPLEQRTEAEVCARWLADRLDVAEGWAPTGAGGACDPGTITAEAQQNALRRTNLFRWLAGADPVVLDEGRVAQQQACAAIQAGLRRLDHRPTADAPCYTAAGAQGAGSSNLAGGAGVADSVDLYVGDRGVPSLGHRRWVINPAMRETAFGWKDAYSCMYSFSSGRAHDVAVMAWPPPGPVPADVPRGDFSVQLYGVRPGADFSIAVGLDGAAPAPVDFDALPIGYGGQVPAYAFDAPDGDRTYRAGRTVDVLLDGLSGHEPIRYRVRFVSCR